MSQKVQFVAAVVSKPSLLILDEPFSGLDPVNAEALKDAVLEMRRRGTTVVFSTHDMATAEKMCDRIFMIFRGRKVLDGTLDEIQAQYGHDTVRVRTAAGAAALAGMRGGEGGERLRTDAGGALAGDPQRFLGQLLARTAVYQFEITRPSLHDIFVRIARPQESSAATDSERTMKNKALIVALHEFTTLVALQGVPDRSAADAGVHGDCVRRAEVREATRRTSRTARSWSWTEPASSTGR